MSLLFGQFAPVPAAEGGDRPKQRAWVVKIAEEATISRAMHQEYRPLGIPYLAWAAEFRLKQYPNDWPNIPSEEGLRKRIQETADERFFRPTPLLNLPEKHLDIDPRASPSVFGIKPRPTSCYLLNPLWLMAQSEWDRFELAKDFAFRCLGVSTMEELKRAVRKP